jgi:hypothetical protein
LAQNLDFPLTLIKRCMGFNVSRTINEMDHPVARPASEGSMGKK